MTRLKLKHAALCACGRVRDENQDAWFARPDWGFYGVADGIGGHAAGEVASRIVAETLPSWLNKNLQGFDDLHDSRARQAISKSLIELGSAIVMECRQRPTLRGMGATVVTIIERNLSAIVAHMGDGRAYLFRDGRLSRLTRDHTIAETLVKAGELDRQRLAHHPGRSQLTRYVGMPNEHLPDVGECFDLCHGDQLLLCTDGLTGMLSDEAINLALAASTGPAAICQSLINAANVAGGRDNITALVVSVLHLSS